MNDTGVDVGDVAGLQSFHVLVDPLFDVTIDDIDCFFLVGMPMECVPLSRSCTPEVFLDGTITVCGQGGDG